MDIPLLTDALTHFLAPALPYLLGLGDRAAEGAAKKLGADGWNKAKEMWRHLRPKVEEKRGALDTAQALAQAPDDVHERQFLGLHLSQVLEADTDLRQAIEKLADEAGVLKLYQAHLEGSGAISQGGPAAGAGGTAAGGDIRDTVIVSGTGHHVEVNRGEGRGRSESEAAEALRAYLERVVEDTGHLLLGGVDPAVVGAERDTRLELSAVYTALLTEGREETKGKLPQPRGEGEPRRLSALEQLDRKKHLVLLGDPGSGKSTFVNFVAFCLAGERLGHEAGGLARLRAPLPKEDGSDGEAPQIWGHGPLLPVRVILRDFAARGLPAVGKKATAAHLWRFVEQELAAGKLAETAPHLEQALKREGGLVLLDGLDEVPEADRRREQLCQAVTDFVKSFRGCRVLVTSRTYAYQEQGWRLAGFPEAVLAPFSAGQIRRFVANWYAHVGALRRVVNPTQRAAALERVIFASERLQGLAERPLLLTLMASLHAWRGGSLPEKREELYANAVDLLLDFWEKQRPSQGRDGHEVWEPSLAEFLKVDRDRVRGLLNVLAFAAHEAQEELKGTADVAQKDLVDGLLKLRGDGKERPDPEDLVRYLSHRSGILVPRGVGVYTFPHRTFQEYLAACWLTEEDFPDQVAELACQDPNRWREVALLAGAKAARGSGANAWQLADALCWREPDSAEREPADEWGALLAGQLLVESADLARVSERNRPKLDRVRRWLVELLGSSELPAVERAAAGVSLARLGDPRFSETCWYLPDDPLLGFVEVPAGRYRIGAKKVGCPHLVTELEEAFVDLSSFYIGKFPVTVKQLRIFLQLIDAVPERLDEVGLGPNQPAVAVTWFEARDYCKWLTKRLQEIGIAKAREETCLVNKKFWVALAVGQLVADLPTEEQWEVAARGPTGLRYPWGNWENMDFANFAELRLQAPTRAC